MNQTAGTIAVVFHDFPLGGSERIAIRLMNRWAAMGRKVVVFCGALRGPLVEMIGKGIDVVECHPVIPRGLGSRRRLGQALAEFTQRRHIDTLFVPGNFHWPALVEMDSVPEDKRPSIVTQISTPLFRHGRGAVQQVVYNFLTRHRLRCVDAAISLSPLTVGDADRVLGRRITQPIRLPALEDGEDTTVLRRASGDTIVAAGRLVKEKGFDVALRAFARVENRATRLVVLGDGPEHANLLSLAASLGVSERVAFPGYVSDITPWLAQARLFLLSSFYEGYGAVLIEALAAGRPVVSTDCGPAIGDLLNGIGSCAVAPVGDHVALGAALSRVLSDTPPDPRVLADTVAGYRIGPIAESYLDVFDRACARRTALTPVAAEDFPEGVVYV